MLWSRFSAFNRNSTAVPVVLVSQLLCNSNLLPLFLKSSIHWSSRSRASLDNYYLRKRRKWPLSPYKAKWHQTFAHQQAMQTLKESAKRTSRTHLLAVLIDSFATYSCDPSPSAYHFIIKTLTKNPFTWDSDQIPQILEHLEKIAVFETPEYIFIDLIKFYGDCDMIRHAVDLFFRIPNFRCNPSVHSLNALLSVICNKKCGLEIVPQILMKSQLMNIRIESSSFDILIRALCRSGEVNYAVELLNHTVTEGFDLDRRIFSLILVTICEEKECNAVDILRSLEDLKKLGFIPDKADWCNIVRFLVNRGSALEAMAALNKMKKEGTKPDIVCCNWVLDRLVSEEEFAKTDELFDQMLVLGLVPDTFTYNAYISGLCKQNNMVKGIKMLACMEELGCRPDLTTYNTILGACCRKGELNLAKMVLKKMELKGVKVNLQTYECLIDGCCNNYQIFYEAFGLLMHMLDNFSARQFIPFDEILCGLCQRGLFDKAFVVLKEMVCRNVTPGRRAWEAILQGYANTHIFELDSFLVDSGSSNQVDNPL